MTSLIDHYFSVNQNKGEGAKKYGIYNSFIFDTSLHLFITRDSIAAINEVIDKKKIKLVRFTELSLMDDETYGAARDLKPLPQC